VLCVPRTGARDEVASVVQWDFLSQRTGRRQDKSSTEEFHRERESSKRLHRVCFITAGPITKLFAWGEEESGGHVL
jgi:hypothetical protein